ncbi:MAG: QueT transporter family protein [Oscillospiraceae bacterium]|nr:QueT transporter family protein [Oscillospiraceae bacterium]
MTQSGITTRRLTLAAIVAAAYAALTVALAPISYGAVQFRVSEALCILPFFFPCTVWGLTVGCVLANLLTGNVFDVVFGSLATLLAALCTAAIGRRGSSLRHGVLACLMPVVFNAVIVGAVLTWAYRIQMIPDDVWLSYAANAASVGFGELVVLFVLGLPLLRELPKHATFRSNVDMLAGRAVEKQTPDRLFENVFSFLLPPVGWILGSLLLAKDDERSRKLGKACVLFSAFSTVIYIVLIVYLTHPAPVG